VREVTLLGQTVNSYRDPAQGLATAPGVGDSPWRHTKHERAVEDESEFPALLRLISERVPGLARLRYTSPHPRHLTVALMRAHAELPVLCRHVHLPVQSGSDRVLKRMIRRYTVAEYHERIEALRGSVPGVTLSTDVIVGFPGETRADFELTLALIERVGFSGLFGFKYSPRPYTPALRLVDDVSESEKSSRLAELFVLSDAQRRRHLESLVGTEQTVLVEGPSAQGGGYTGRTERNEIAHIECGGDDPRGELLDVRVTRAFKNSLAATPLDERIRRGALQRFERREPRQLPVL
jgi:tRNA-2-methylthio-N6-dimethylallyladenosine synthase